MEVEEPAKKVGKFPKQVFFVLGNELCERFSYYGIRAVLILYLTRQLRLTSETSKLIYHTSSMLTYFIPLFGGLLADIYWGKFKTILYVSIIYAFGNVFLSLVSIPDLNLNPKLPLVMVALTLIAIGAGGIKPCVVSFGGDQFVKGQESMRDKFFSIFYFCINIGAAMSMVLSPIFRADVSCFGEVECYPLAFGFPALLMVIATILFLVGKPFYKIFPPNGTAVVDVVKCIWRALVSRRKSGEKKSHWLDYAEDKYESSYIQDVRTVLSVLLLFLPLPMFWALFDQQGSTWTLQSAKLNGRLGNFEIHPDQMDSLNAILVIIFVPIFTFVVYPLLAKCNLLKTPLQKMCTGGFLAAISFLIGGFMQLSIEAKLPQPPLEGTTDLTMINTINCPIELHYQSQTINLNRYDFSTLSKLQTTDNFNGTIKLNCENSPTIQPYEFSLKFRDEKAYSIVIAKNDEGIQIESMEQIRQRETSKAKPFIRFIFTHPKPFANATLLLTQRDLPGNSADLYQQITFNEQNPFFTSYINVYSLIKCQLCWTHPDEHNCSESPLIHGEISIYKGGISDFLLTPFENDTNKMEMVEMMSFSPDSLHILLQSPMYIIITIGEVMLSISGLTFAYNEAPPGMKAVLQSAWLLTVAFGNVIVILVVKLKDAFFADALESTYFFTFAILLAVDMFIFTLLSIRYKYKSKD